jgi:histidine kinase
MLKYLKKIKNSFVSKTTESPRVSGQEKNSPQFDMTQYDQLGRLSKTIDPMGERIKEEQSELKKQRDEYQSLFELVPCIITVQDKNYKLQWYNQEFSEKFNPMPDDYCYHAYKGRTKKCTICPVERTFEDGKPHSSEETGVNKDGTPTHWIVKTAPIKNERGEIIAAIEMNVDVTHRKSLEDELKKSEEKYYAIFNNIPNPVFVLEIDSLEILDCNDSMNAVYGYTKDEIKKKSFLMFFKEEEKEEHASLIRTTPFINRARHITKLGKTLFVDIRVSPSEYTGKKVLLVTTSDITQQHETEQQLIQASKMATLGEMATGVAHELNQPLTVIKTASGFFMKKINKSEKIKEDILFTMASEIDSHVDRAAKIIDHMRQFGRKSDMSLKKVQVNDLLERALDILGQQLKIREIEVAWDLEHDLPEVMADPSRLEQVFINLIINARDAIDAKWQSEQKGKAPKRISLKTRSDGNMVIVTMSDTGIGIPKDHLEKVFEPFYTTKEVGQGTGLGLSISYGIIQDCQGTIDAVPNEDGGASFIIVFPALDES